jgi:hypothetical protein
MVVILIKSSVSLGRFYVYLNVCSIADLSIRLPCTHCNRKGIVCVKQPCRACVDSMSECTSCCEQPGEDCNPPEDGNAEAATSLCLCLAPSIPRCTNNALDEDSSVLPLCLQPPSELCLYQGSDAAAGCHSVIDSFEIPSPGMLCTTA